MRKSKTIILIIALALAGVAGLYFYNQTGQRIEAEEAHVAVDDLLVSSRISAYVLSVDVDNGAEVAEGALLVQLDPSSFQVALSEAKAVLAAMERGVPQGIARSLLARRSQLPDQTDLESRLSLARQAETAARAMVEELSTQAAAATLERRRLEAGRAGNDAVQAAKSREMTLQVQFNDAKDKHDTVVLFRSQTEKDLDQLKLALQQLNSQTAAAMTEILPDEIAAQAERVRQAELALMDTQIVAPVAGRVTMLSIRPGEMASEGQPLLSIVPDELGKFYVLAYFRMEYEPLLREGLVCAIRLPDSGNQSVDGQLLELRRVPAPDQAAPVDAAAGAGEWLEALILADGPDAAAISKLTPGQKAEVSVQAVKQ